MKTKWLRCTGAGTLRFSYALPCFTIVLLGHTYAQETSKPQAAESQVNEQIAPDELPPDEAQQQSIAVPSADFRPLGPPSITELDRLFPEIGLQDPNVGNQEKLYTYEPDSATVLLEQMLSSPDPATRLRGIEGMEASGEDAVVAPLITMLADPEPAVQIAARRALTNIPQETLAQAVVATLGWGEPTLAVALDEALPQLRGELEGELVRRLEAKGTARIERMTVAYALGRIGSVRAGASLAALVWGDDLVLAYYCADALTKIDDQSLLREYTRMATHPQVYMRTASYRGLARIGGDEARAAMTEAAAGRTEPDTSARKLAIRMLAYVGDDSTVEFLITLVQARTGLVEAASDALATMTGLPRGLQRERWLEWYSEMYLPAKQAQASRAPGNRPDQPKAPPPLIGFPEDGFPFTP